MKKQILKLALVLFALMSSFSFTQAQGTVTGKVIDQESGAPLVGVAIKIVGQTKGAIADMDGYFELEVSGKVSLEIAYMGYEHKTIEVDVANGSTKNLGKIRMIPEAIGIGGVNIIADRAKERETPVAISNVDAKQLKMQLGSQDLPMVMNSTPGVYATANGGGAGDARINVRGFNQRNVAIMINGVPVNDMENGWVYWSNWDGIADATSSIQMQRGLSAVNLATPSIGGTMNIITSPAEMKAGVSGKFEAGSGGFMKTTLSGHSGLIDDKYAVSASVVRKVGNGVIDGTWTDAWAYYFGASYNLNKNHRLEVYAVGAPQRHGQNLYKQNVAAYDADYAKSIGADSAVAHKFTKASDRGILYNENWSPVSESYNGQQSWNGKSNDRYGKDFINERENFYHKPIANLNWYGQWSKKLTQFTTFYWSGGTGGGSGTYGKMKYDYSSEPTRIVDYDATIANNTTSDTARGILRNSNNNQNTFGAITKFKYKASDKLKFQAGLDWRTATIEHYRDVRDLLGGKFYIDKSNKFESGDQYNKVLGDKIAYWNTNTVDWFGGYIQGEYKTEKVSLYGTYGYSMIKYTFTDHFRKNDAGGERYSESAWISGQQIKGGVSYRATDGLSVFGNIGFVSKVPIFDNVIDDYSGVVASEPANEKFQAYEAGVLYNTPDRKLDVKANYYYTLWKDRALSRGIVNPDGSEGIVFLSGMNQKHSGLEFEANYTINKMFGVGAMGSFGNWTYTDNVTGTYKNYNPDTTISYNYYVSGLRVGDAPQTQMAGWLDVNPIKGLTMQFIYRYNTSFYADWDPFTRTDATDNAQVWQVPSYGLFDIHLIYKLPLKGRVGVEIFGHIFNTLNEMYISDAVDNSRYNGYYGTDDQLGHTANSAEVYMGLPRTFNVGLKVSFK